MKAKIMRILGLLMGFAWIAFGIFILVTYGVELTSRFFGALSIIGTGIVFVWYGMVKKRRLSPKYIYLGDAPVAVIQ